MQGMQDGRRRNQGGFDQMSNQSNHQQHPDELYATLLLHVRHCLEVVLQNEFEESTQAVTTFAAAFTLPDGTGMAVWINASQGYQSPTAFIRGRILEVFAHWVRQKSRNLDYMVFTLQASQHTLLDMTRAQAYRMQLEQACEQTNTNEALSEFIFSTLVEVLGADSACLGSMLAAQLLSEVRREDILAMIERPSTLLSLMVCQLEELQAKVSKIVMELYVESNFLTYDEHKQNLMMFFPYFTVETTTGTLEVHECITEGTFAESLFRVELVDSCGLLLRLLRHLEFLCNGGADGREVVIAVDFEGLKLCRHGALCLVQMTCSDDPTLVYVLDVYVLGKRAFNMTTADGTSMKSILERDDVRKAWFDPRNDIDALYHQFGIMPRGIFDLQLAEVADRRKRGLNVHFVQGLYKCLTQCPALQSEQKVFAEKINSLGKRLFEPQNGGSYEIFQERPLNPVILVYAAHDSRYMLLLYEQYLQCIGDAWAERVCRAGEERGRWCLNTVYNMPGSEAPDI